MAEKGQGDEGQGGQGQSAAGGQGAAQGGDGQGQGGQAAGGQAPGAPGGDAGQPTDVGSKPEAGGGGGGSQADQKGPGDDEQLGTDPGWLRGLADEEEARVAGLADDQVDADGINVGETRANAQKLRDKADQLENDPAARAADLRDGAEVDRMFAGELDQKAQEAIDAMNAGEEGYSQEDVDDARSGAADLRARAAKRAAAADAIDGRSTADPLPPPAQEGQEVASNFGVDLGGLRTDRIPAVEVPKSTAKVAEDLPREPGAPPPPRLDPPAQGTA